MTSAQPIRLDDIEAEAVRVVAAAVGAVIQQRALACAIMRVAGDTYAKLTDPDEASAQHASLARRHAENATRGRL